MRALRSLALLLTALALVPVGAHLAALPNKLALDAAGYLAAQRAYDGWALFGSAMLGAILADLAWAWALRRRGQPWGAALAAGLLMAATLLVFLAFTQPANAATQNWHALPAGWEALRAQWEWSHAANAVLTFGALVLLVLSLPPDSGREPPGP